MKLQRIIQSTYFSFLFFIYVLLFISCDSATTIKDHPVSEYESHFNLEWAQNTTWDDGNAEVAVYDAERVIYNKVRRSEYIYIAVKEDFNREFNVKTNNYDRNDLFPVIKINQFARFQTDNYPYHFLTSLFLNREKPFQVFKMTTSSQEWCGNTFKEFLLNDNAYLFHYHSYFDKEGDMEKQINEFPLLFEDQLFFTLRTLKFQDGLRFSAKVLETQVANKATFPYIFEANFTVIKDTITTDTVVVSCWRVDVVLDDKKQNQYWFDTIYPNILLKYNAWDGRKLVLKTIKRYPYWKRNDPVKND